MTDKQVETVARALVEYRNNYASMANEANYKDKTYDELMGMISAGMEASPRFKDEVTRYENENLSEVENNVESTLDLRVDSLKLAIESGDIIEVLKESGLLVGFMVDDLPEFFASEPIEKVISKDFLHEALKKRVEELTKEDTRRYLLMWDNYTYNNEPEIWAMDKFRDNKWGFSEEDLNQIVLLSTNEEYETGNVLIKRIK